MDADCSANEVEDNAADDSICEGEGDTPCESNAAVDGAAADDATADDAVEDIIVNANDTEEVKRKASIFFFFFFFFLLFQY